LLFAQENFFMQYSDLRDFLNKLEKLGDFKRISQEISPRLEITEICQRLLEQGGPAVLFEHPAGHAIPVVANVFGTQKRVAQAMGVESTSELRHVGELLANLKEPEPPEGFRDALSKVALLKSALWDMAPRRIRGRTPDPPDPYDPPAPAGPAGPAGTRTSCTERPGEANAVALRTKLPRKTPVGMPAGPRIGIRDLRGRRLLTCTSTTLQRS